jgi:hypothetical protein
VLAAFALGQGIGLLQKEIQGSALSLGEKVSWLTGTEEI